VADYPVSFAVERQTTERNRLTTGFRFILAIRHVLLVGGPGFGFGACAARLTSALARA
jgi:hypothetical protein